MANSTAKFGFIPVGGLDNKGFGGLRAYFIPSSVTAPVAIGDVVTHTVGTNAGAINGIPAGVLPVCAVEAATVSAAKAITGIVVGIMPENPFLSVAEQGAGSKGRVVYVMDDKDALFKVCAKSGETIKVGGNCGFEYNAPANGVSGAVITATTTTAGLPFRVVGVVADPTVADATQYIVRINSSTEANAVAGLN